MRKVILLFTIAAILFSFNPSGTVYAKHKKQAKAMVCKAECMDANGKCKEECKDANGKCKKECMEMMGRNAKMDKCSTKMDKCSTKMDKCCAKGDMKNSKCCKTDKNSNIKSNQDTKEESKEKENKIK